MLELILQRLWYTDRSCCGELTAGIMQLFTLELPVKDGLPGSAIPPGRYQIELAPSPKFLKSADPWVKHFASAMPHIIGIPKRSLIMIHWGNNPENTDGCVLVGLKHEPDMVIESRQAFEPFYEFIEGPAKAGECFVNVQGGTPMKPDPPQLGVDESTQL